MKQIKRTYLVVLAVFAILLSACGGTPAAAPADQAAIKVNASLIAYTGTVESIDGDQWVVNGQFLTVDPAVIQDGPFQVGDTIKVEGDVNPDGSITVTRVEMPSADDLTQLPQIGDPPADGNTNDTNTNDANVNDDNGNNANSNNANSNDDDDDDGNSNTSVGNSNDDDDHNSNSSNSGNSNDDDDSSGSNGNGDDHDDDHNDDHDDNSNSSGGSNTNGV